MSNYSEDPIQDDSKQKDLSEFRLRIEDIMAHGIQGNIINETIQDISPSDIGVYLTQIMGDQDFPLKNPRLTRVNVNDFDLLIRICDYASITLLNVPTSINLYVLECGDFATIIMPIDLGDNTTDIFMQPLEDTPEEIQELWQKALDEKAKKKQKGKIDLTKISEIKMASQL